LVDNLKNFIKKYDFDTGRIYFEVTETSLSANLAQASKILNSIKEMGFNLSLDDFGTGYSSLAYLRELPFDAIKIDKKFIDNIKFSLKDKKLLQSIISMAKILDMKIVLEGIESYEQLKNIKKSSYIKYQGFYFYKPMFYEKLLSLV
jgi:EAL domain-containing protein (putative c-di-GMP-specific phosphodiesterase class I)